MENQKYFIKLDLDLSKTTIELKKILDIKNFEEAEKKEKYYIGSAESPLWRGEKGVCKIDNLDILHTPNPSPEGTLRENQHSLYIKIGLESFMQEQLEFWEILKKNSVILNN